MPQNYYKMDKIQKKLPKQVDEQLEYTGCKINKHMLICGATGTGKTITLFDYIIQTSKPRKGTFKKIFVCYKTDEILYDVLKDELKDGILFFKSVSEFPSVNDFPDAITNDYKDNYLIVFDDCIGDKDKMSYKKIEDYMTYGRKKNLTIIFLTQSFFQTNIFLRKQVSYVLLLSIKGKRDLNAILSDYGSLQANPEELYRIFKIATTPTENDEMPFLKISADAGPDNKKFSKSWTEYLEFESKI